MISLLKNCTIYVDNGSNCGDGCCWNPWWESEDFEAGDEIDDDDPKFDLSGLTQDEDFVRI